MQDHTDNDNEPVAPAPAAGLAEAQIAAIEGAFAEHDRMLARLRKEVAELRDSSPLSPELEPAAEPVVPDEALEDRLKGIEARLDRQDQALKHMLQRLIGFFERERPEED